MSQKFEKLLKRKDLNGRKWSLLYRGSRDGFRASDFHSRCDDKPNTLTIVKSTGNIFGGYASAQWKSDSRGLWQEDESAFIFSLVNKEKRPLIFEQLHTTFYKCSTYSMNHFGPVFGSGYDLLISDSSDMNTKSYANLGNTYTHPEYPLDSLRAETILTDTFCFRVKEIEVFQLQQ